MAKRKRGGFSFLEAKKPKVEVKKVIRRTITTSTPAIRITENRAGSLDIYSYSQKARCCLSHSFSTDHVEISETYTGPLNHRYFYIYLFMTNEEIERAKRIIAITFQKSIADKRIIATYIRNAVKEILFAPEPQKLPVRDLPVTAIMTRSNINSNNRRSKAVRNHSVALPKKVENRMESLNIGEDRFSALILERILKISNYGTLFGHYSMPEVILKDTLKGMKERSAWKAFVDKIFCFTQAYSIQIDGHCYNFGYRIDFEEPFLSWGNSLKGKCGFKGEPSSIFVNTESQMMILMPNKKMRSAIVFDYVTDNWYMTAYILYSFFSSKCRYKRTYVPIPMLKTIGIIKMHRLYRTNTKNHFISGRWFLLTNNKNNFQRAYKNDASMIGLI